MNVGLLIEVSLQLGGLDLRLGLRGVVRFLRDAPSLGVQEGIDGATTLFKGLATLAPATVSGLYNLAEGHGSARQLLADGLVQGEGCLHRGGGVQGQEVPCHGTAVVVEDDGEPRLARVPLLITNEDIEFGMVRLPDGVGRFRLPAVDEVEGLAVGFG